MFANPLQGKRVIDLCVRRWLYNPLTLRSMCVCATSDKTEQVSRVFVRTHTSIHAELALHTKINLQVSLFFHISTHTFDWQRHISSPSVLCPQFKPERPRRRRITSLLCQTTPSQHNVWITDADYTRAAVCFDTQISVAGSKSRSTALAWLYLRLHLHTVNWTTTTHYIYLCKITLLQKWFQ